ncbi:hypothetical protein BDY21DRAFT_212258 [Lineolata rhizophorae]|uniref:Uncharacterized protein n=1 Tax=Lineolata rhizophorae TaxID=578093 RepID=A0A6A6P444_9PEZI|nr:hypothetical protein BDY21DRAFT_212258 [Lineolata rhizophorae]
MFLSAGGELWITSCPMGCALDKPLSVHSAIPSLAGGRPWCRASAAASCIRPKHPPIVPHELAGSRVVWSVRSRSVGPPRAGQPCAGLQWRANGGGAPTLTLRWFQSLRMCSRLGCSVGGLIVLKVAFKLHALQEVHKSVVSPSRPSVSGLG